MELYEEILRDFGFSRNEDEMAARLMKELAGDSFSIASSLSL